MVYYDGKGYPGEVDPAERLAAGLPPWYPRDKESGNYRLLGAIALRLAEGDYDIDELDLATTVQTAWKIAQLEELGELVDCHHRENEPLERYRGRVLQAFALVTSEGTINQLLNLSGNILDIDIKGLEYTESYTQTNGDATLFVPSRAIQSSPFTDEELSTLLGRNIPAGYTLNILIRGGFIYISPEDYNTGNYDPENGYAGLDENGNRTRDNNGYAGVI